LPGFFRAWQDSRPSATSRHDQSVAQLRRGGICRNAGDALPGSLRQPLRRTAASQSGTISGRAKDRTNRAAGPSHPPPCEGIRNSTLAVGVLSELTFQIGRPANAIKADVFPKQSLGGIAPCNRDFMPTRQRVSDSLNASLPYCLSPSTLDRRPAIMLAIQSVGQLTFRLESRFAGRLTNQLVGYHSGQPPNQQDNLAPS